LEEAGEFAVSVGDVAIAIAIAIFIGAAIVTIIIIIIIIAGTKLSGKCS